MHPGTLGAGRPSQLTTGCICGPCTLDTYNNKACVKLEDSWTPRTHRHRHGFASCQSRTRGSWGCRACVRRQCGCDARASAHPFGPLDQSSIGAITGSRPCLSPVTFRSRSANWGLSSTARRRGCRSLPVDFSLWTLPVNSERGRSRQGAGRGMRGDACWASVRGAHDYARSLPSLGSSAAPPRPAIAATASAVGSPIACGGCVANPDVHAIQVPL